MKKRRLLQSGRIDFFQAIVFTVLFAAGALAAPAQTADQAWLRRSIMRAEEPSRFLVRTLDQGLIVRTAARELNYALNGSPGPDIDDFTNQIVLGTAAEVRKAYPQIETPEKLTAESFWINTTHPHHGTLIIVAGGDERG